LGKEGERKRRRGMAVMAGKRPPELFKRGGFFLEGFVERRFRLGSGSMALEKKENTMGKERREERTKK